MTPPDAPAGEYVPEPTPTAARRAELIAEVADLPAKLRGLVAGLSPEQLATPYKKWTVRQIVHHLADSHMNAFVRFRWTLTEETPTIKPYDETRWTELPDTKAADIGLSLSLLDALHARWVYLMRALADADWERAYHHPEYGKTFRLAEVVGLYAHHGRHHAGQIAWLKLANGW